MKIAIYAQNTRRAGKVCYNDELIESGSDDVIVYDGSEHELKSIAESYLENFKKSVDSNTYFYKNVADSILNEI